MSNEAITWAYSIKAGSTGAKAVLVCLANRANKRGECFPDQATIGAEIETCAETVQKYLRELAAAGLVTRQRRHRPDGSRASDLYILPVVKTEPKQERSDLGETTPKTEQASPKPELAKNREPRQLSQSVPAPT
jgi:pyocin large subunit-like protein